MLKENLTRHASATIRWKSPEELGSTKRRPPPNTNKYAITAYLATESQDFMFSVVLYYPPIENQDDVQLQQAVDLSFVAPDLVLKKLNLHDKLILTVGALVVGYASIQEIYG